MVRIIQRRIPVRNAYRFVLMMMCIAVFPFLIGCSSGGGGSGQGGGTPPAPGSFVGSWIGSVNTSLSGGGDFSLVFDTGVRDETFDLLATSRGIYTSPISGTWIADFFGDDNDDAGSFTGTHTGGVLTGVFSSEFGFCPVTFTATVSGTSISGSFTTFNCAEVETGSFSGVWVGADIIPDISGNSFGVIESNNAGQGILTASIVQNGIHFEGRMVADFPGPNFDDSGDIFGNIDGNMMYFKFLPDDPADCPFNGAATIGDDFILGDFEAFFCNNVDVFGSFSLER
jgi:hypothetical protein